MGAIIIAGVSCLALVLSVLLKPELKIKNFSLPVYPLIAVLGAIAAVAFTPLTLTDCFQGLTRADAVNPLKILTLFISVTAISIFLDEGGFFEYLAHKILSHAGGNQHKLFLLLYVSVSVLTVFTSNDIIILTFTPFIIYFCKNAGIRAMPYLMAEFVAANTWSMALIIGNPTNIYLATSAGITFFTYAGVMILPTLAAGVVSACVLFLLFRKTLKQPFEVHTEEAVLKDKPMCVLGGAVLIVCTISLSVSNFIRVEMWLECVICAGVLILVALIICLARHRVPVILGRTLLRLPYALIPFVLSMFIISLSLDKAGVTAAVAGAFSVCELPLYGVSSFLCANLVNNIPMSIIFSSMLAAGEASYGAVFASIVGSNLGALLTPIGALAGIMFSSILKKHGEYFPAREFIRYGVCVSTASLAVTLGTLALVLMI